MAINQSTAISNRSLRVEVAKLSEDIERGRYKLIYSPAAGEWADRISKINSDPEAIIRAFNEASLKHLDFSKSKEAYN